MRIITGRQMARKPSLVSAIKPGESVHLADRKGGLVITRQKPSRMTPAEMMTEVAQLSAGCPALDTKAFLEDGE